MSESNFSLDELRLKLEAYCAYQERCKSEILHKLKLLNALPETYEPILTSLKENRFWDEERFACAYAQGKLRIKHWGRNKIRQGLMAKFVGKQEVLHALNTLDDQEYWEALKYELNKKHQDTAKENDPWKRKVKCINYALSKGFEQELILEAYQQLSRGKFC